MASVRYRHNLKERPWRAQIRLKGFKEKSKNFKTEKEAKAWALVTEEAMRSQPVLMKYTLNNFLDRLEVDILPKKNPLYVKKEIPYILFWRSQLGDKIATEITSEEIEVAANSLYNRQTRLGKSYSPETRRKYIQTLTYLYNIAIKHWKWAVINPAMHVDLHTDSIKESQNRIKTAEKDISWKTFKGDFIYAVLDQLKDRGIPTHIGIEMMRFLDMSKHSLQTLLDPNHNSTIASLFNVAKKLDITVFFQHKDIYKQQN